MLRDSEARLRQIVDNTTAAIFAKDREGRYLIANREFERLTGRLSRDVIGRTDLEIFPADFAARLRNNDLRVLRECRAMEFEETLDIAGVPRTYLSSKFPLLDAQGEACGVCGIATDITERKLAEETLRRSEDHLRATLRAALDCIIVMDARGTIIEFNPAAEACFGHSRDQVIGHSLAELLIPPRYREAHVRGLQRYLQSGQGPFLGRRVELTALRADGTEFPVELATGVSSGPDGRMFIGYLRDITERKLAEERRARLEARLRQAQKMEAIGQLTGGIAHDFNNLLASIMGYIVLATERQEDLGDARLASYLEQAYLSCERARNLIQQMLMFSRGQRGAPRPLAVKPLLERSLGLLRSMLPATIEMQVELDPHTAAVMLDPVQLEQVLLNLCLNARDALNGAGRIRIALRTSLVSGGTCVACRQPVSGKLVELSVEDDGPGMTEDLLERIFEPFFSTKESGKGTGMGLAMVHGIVHEHGGHVIVETAPGDGARFRVLLPPLVGAQALEPVRPAAAGLGSCGRASLSGNVLIVDDEVTIGEFMRELLETWGVSATFISRPQEALDAIVREPGRFDLVITDQTMPRMTGIDLAHALRAIRPDLPVILYTGFGEKITAADLRGAGIRAMLPKPVEPQKLAAVLVEHLAAPDSTA